MLASKSNAVLKSRTNHAWEIIHEGGRVRPFQMFDSSWRGRYTAVRDRGPPLVSRREIDVL